MFQSGDRAITLVIICGMLGTGVHATLEHVRRLRVSCHYVHSLEGVSAGRRIFSLIICFSPVMNSITRNCPQAGNFLRRGA